jgi:hypothetical protein
MTDYQAVTQQNWDEAQARICNLECLMAEALYFVEQHTPELSTQGTMISLRDRMRKSLGTCGSYQAGLHDQRCINCGGVEIAHSRSALGKEVKP